MRISIQILFKITLCPSLIRSISVNQELTVQEFKNVIMGGNSKFSWKTHDWILLYVST